jgi:hypothetical protein
VTAFFVFESFISIRVKAKEAAMHFFQFWDQQIFCRPNAFIALAVDLPFPDFLLDCGKYPR